MPRRLTAILGRKLVAGSIAVLGVRVANIFAALGISVLLLRVLGLEQFGLFVTYQAAVALVVLPITAGLPNLVVREASLAYVENDKAKVRGILSFAVRSITIYLAAVAAVAAAIFGWLNDFGTSRALLVALALHAGFQSLAAIRSALLRSAGQVVRGQLLERLVQPVLVILFNAVLYLYRPEGYGVLQAVLAVVAAHAVAFVWGGYWVGRYAIRPGPIAVVDRSRLKRDAMHLSGSGMLSSVLVNGLVLMTSAMATVEATGLYRLATTVTQPLIYVHEVLAQVVAPRLSQLWHLGDRASVEKILRVGVLASFASVCIGSVALLLIGGPAIEWAYGVRSESVMYAVAWLCLAHCANAAAGFDHELLFMAGHPGSVLRTTAVVVPLSLLLAVPAIGLHGGAGAAAALAAYQLGVGLLVTGTARRITGMDTSIFGLVPQGRQVRQQE